MRAPSREFHLVGDVNNPHDLISLICFFFFQAEDGIRVLTVTGVQTCALPISRVGKAALSGAPASAARPGARAMEERGAHLSARRVPRRLMRIDVNAFLGAYPYRRVPATSPDGLLHAMTRAGIDEAWGSHLPSLFWRQPIEGNARLYATAAREPRLKPVPAVHPGLSGWAGALGEAAERAAPS